MTPAEADAAIGRLERLAARHDAVVDGRRVTWRRFGRGDPLVLLHGGHGSWLHWVRNLAAWSARQALWVPDMPGYGDSDDAAGGGLDDLVGPLSASLDGLVGAGTPLVLAGFSFGGVVAATWAARRPTVSHLVLLGPGGHGGPRRPRGALRPWRELVPHSPPWRETMRHNLLMHMLHHEASVDELALQVHGRACLATRFQSKALSRAAGLRSAIEAFGGPVLQVWGAQDITAFPADAAAALASPHPRSEVHVIEDAGHWVHYEQADAVNARVADWLSSGPARTGALINHR